MSVILSALQPSWPANVHSLTTNNARERQQALQYPSRAVMDKGCERVAFLVPSLFKHPFAKVSVFVRLILLRGDLEALPSGQPKPEPRGKTTADCLQLTVHNVEDGRHTDSTAELAALPECCCISLEELSGILGLRTWSITAERRMIEATQDKRS